MDSIVGIVASQVSSQGQPLLQAGEFVRCVPLRWAVKEMLVEYPELARHRFIRMELRHVARTKQDPVLGVVRIPWIQVCLYEYMRSFDYIDLPVIVFREPYSSGLLTCD